MSFLSHILLVPYWNSIFQTQLTKSFILAVFVLISGEIIPGNSTLPVEQQRAQLRTTNRTTLNRTVLPSDGPCISAAVYSMALQNLVSLFCPAALYFHYKRSQKPPLVHLRPGTGWLPAKGSINIIKRLIQLDLSLSVSAWRASRLQLINRFLKSQGPWEVADVLSLSICLVWCLVGCGQSSTNERHASIYRVNK